MMISLDANRFQLSMYIVIYSTYSHSFSTHADYASTATDQFKKNYKHNNPNYIGHLNSNMSDYLLPTVAFCQGNRSLD